MKYSKAAITKAIGYIVLLNLVSLVKGLTGHSAVSSLARAQNSDPVGFYVHIPYCRRRCRYCNFSIVPVGKDLPNSNSFDVIHHQYQADLFRELETLPDLHKHIIGEKKQQIALGSVYFGGGTPSLAPVSMIQGVLERIRQSFAIETDAEITIEMDPGTFDRLQLQQLKALGINRISLGVQSFDDKILENLGRVHRLQDIEKAIEIIHAVFGETPNYSMDIISGVPGLTEAQWIQTLQKAISFQPPHLSVYDLQVEDGTVFGAWYNGQDAPTSKRQTPALPDEDSVAFMYKYCAGYLRAHGYEHYEVSSYAQCRTSSSKQNGNNRSRHNQVYWAASSSWFAVGLGATSCLRGQLLARPKTISEYHEWVQNIEPSNDMDRNGLYVSNEEMLTDIIMKRLRTSDGLDLRWVEQKFGKETRKAILNGAKLGFDLNMVTLEDGDPTSFGNDESILRLKDPIGFLYSNYLISGIFAELGYE